MQVQSLGQEGPLEEGVAILSSILTWIIPWTEEPGGLQCMGSRRVRHDWSDLVHTYTHGSFSFTFLRNLHHGLHNGCTRYTFEWRTSCGHVLSKCFSEHTNSSLFSSNNPACPLLTCFQTPPHPVIPGLSPAPTCCTPWWASGPCPDPGRLHPCPVLWLSWDFPLDQPSSSPTGL